MSGQEPSPTGHTQANHVHTHAYEVDRQVRQRQPRKEEDCPAAHYVYPTKGRQPREEEDRPKARYVYQLNGN